MRMNKISSTLTSLFLFFYLCYAISPLSYSIAGCQHGRTSSEAAKATKTIRLLIVDSLLSSLLQQEKEAGEGLDNESTLILLQKKRALRSFGDIMARPASHTALHHEIPPTLYIVSDKQQFLNSEFKCTNEFELLHSGISPPSA